MKNIILFLLIFNTFYCDAQVYNLDGSIPKSDSVLFQKFIKDIDAIDYSTINSELKNFKKKHKQLYNKYTKNFPYKSIEPEYHQFMKGHQIHSGLYANCSGFSYIVFGKIYKNNILYLLYSQDYFIVKYYDERLTIFISKYDKTGTILDFHNLKGNNYYDEIIQFINK